jgi:outer membrane receptor protein involved in Fe transport
LVTASAGMSYAWDGTRYSVDIVAGTGVRTTEPNVSPGVFNNGTVPSYEQVNFGVSHRFEQAPGGPIEIRADLINVLDEVYLLRSQSGIGVAAPQYGPRRTFFMGVRKFFN